MDYFAILLGALQAVIVLALLFIVPGLTLAPSVVPGASTPLTRLARAAGVSLLVTAVACTLMARVGLLHPLVVVIVLVGLAVLPLFSRIPRRPHLPSQRARRWWLGAGAAAVVAAVLVVVPSRLEVGPNLLPFTSTVWYYANLARAVATSGGFPSGLPEWGAIRPFQTDYLPVTAHTAAGLQLLPGELVVQMEIYRIAVLIAGLLMATLLFRRWLSSWIALLAAILLLATVRLEFKFLAYKPETFSLVLALFGLWLVDRALVERSRRLVVAAAVTGSVVFMSHAEVFLVFAAGVGGLALARWLVAQSGGPERAGGFGRPHPHRLGIRPDFGRRGLASLAVGAAVVATAGIAGVAATAALTGEFRIVAYVTGDRGAGDEPPPLRNGEIPAGWQFTSDPTWDFYVAAVAPGQLGQRPPSTFTDRRLLPRAIAHVWPGLDARSGSMAVVLGGLLAFPVVAWPFLDARRRRLLVTWASFGLALAAGSYLLFVVADTYVPMRVGPRRLMPYELLLPVVAAALGLWIVDRLLRPGWRALLPTRGAMLAAGAALVVLAAGVISSGPQLGEDDDQEPGLTPVGYEAYRWIALNTPADARILANAYTDGSLGGLAERTGIVDGRAVYLEDRAFLAESTALVLGARVLFAEPDGVAASAYLSRNGVDYLLVAGAGATGSDLGGYRPFDTDLAALASSDRYTLVRAFGDGRLLLYEVQPGS